MEDIVPLIFFLVIVVVNGIKFLITRAGKKASSGNAPDTEKTAPKPSSPFDQFFEKIAEQLEPKPQPEPDLPEEFVRPDYAREMAEYEQEQVEEPLQPAVYIPELVSEATPLPKQHAPAIVQIPTQKLQTSFSSSHGIRMPGMNAFIQTGNKTKSDFRIEGNQDLRRAMLAHVIFSPPRALDLSFDNTIARSGQV